MDPRLLFLLMYFGSFNNMSKLYRKKAREYGYTDTNSLGRSFVKGRRASKDALKQVEWTMIRQGHNVRQDGWTKEARAAVKRQGYVPGTYDKFLQNAYSDYRGSQPILPDSSLAWFRVWSCENPKAKLSDVRTAVLLEYGATLSRSSIRNYLQRAGITRQRLRRIAAQRFTPENLQYAQGFQQRIRKYAHPCWFDESGISQSGMQGRDNVGLGIRGAGGAYIREALQYPPDNLSVLGLIDKQGMFCVESHVGGTDTVRVDEYIQRHVRTLHLRGVDVVVLDNCPSHRIASIAFWLQMAGIAVEFLPRYWPQWNPIELAWNDMKNHLGTNLTALRNEPGKSIEDALLRIPTDRCNNWIRHCGCYKEGTHYV